MVIEELAEAYEEYAATAEEPRKHSLREIVTGWLSGKGQEPFPQDEAFAKRVEKCIAQIIESDDDTLAFKAAEIILGVPHSENVYAVDLMQSAMHSHVLKLVERLSPSEASRALELLKQVPRCYRFPVQKELSKKLEARAAE